MTEQAAAYDNATPTKRRGPKPLFDEPVQRVGLTLDRDTVRFMTELGHNNMSGGIRKAASILKKLQEDGKLDESFREAA